MMSKYGAWACALAAMVLTTDFTVAAQKNGPQRAQSDASAPAASPDVPAGYIIGPGDVLTVNFWRRNDVSGDVVVRPDGQISLMLLDDVQAAGLTPEQLRDKVAEKAAKYFEDTRVTVVVKEINSRMVYITGLIAKPGSYRLRTRLTVVQLIAEAGGLLEFAGADHIAIMRTENGRETGFVFNYDDIIHLRKLEQNIELKPGDTVIVP